MTRGRALAAAVATLCASTAHASAPDVFGFGSEATALGGAVVASGSDFSALFYDPAALSAGDGNTVAFGYLGNLSLLDARGETAEVEEPHGFLLGLTGSLPFLGRANGLRIGAAFYALPDTIVRVITVFPEDPHYPYFHNRTQRLVILPGAAIRLSDALSVGVSANVMAGLDGPATTREGPTRAVETSVAEEIFLRASVVAGMRLAVHPEVAYAIAYRQEMYVPYSIQTSNEVGGTSLDIDVDAIGLFTPHEIVAGMAWSPPGWRFGLDFTYKAWGRYDHDFVRVKSRLPGIGTLDPGLPDSPWRDSFDLRTGVERTIPVGHATDLFLRTGVSFEPTPILPQSGRTNMLDGDHCVLAIGAGVRLADFLEVPVRFDVHAQWHEILPRTYRKEVHARSDDPWAIVDERPGDADPGIQVSNPGYPEIEASGRVLSGGAVLTLEVE